MISKHSLLLLSVIILFAYLSKAQVKTKTFARGIPDNVIPVKEIAGREYKILPLAEFNNLKILANKNMSLADRSRFALSTPVDIDILKEATLIKTGTTAIYYFTLKAIDAYNISIQFNKFILSKNSLLSIYNKTELTDSITAKENNETDTWSTRVYQGNTLHIILNIPLEELGQSTLNLGFVYFGYKKTGFTPHFGSPGASDPCQVNVACPAGNGWNNERNSVALINANGHWATGALVMNTCGTNRPYLLTANHNLSVGNVQNWVFQFLFYSTDCNTDIGYREDIQINGCTVRASNGASDFALLELNQTPPVNSGINYAGWSRDSNPFLITSTTFLHHPAGDVLKISVDVGNPVQAPAGAIQCWRLALNSGGDQGGSSGGPYFNQQHRIIGQHYGVPTEHIDEPCHPEKYGGRFDLSWTGGGTNATRLSNWLDPGNLGATTTNTTNVSSLININGMSISGNSSLCSGSSTPYSVTGLPAGATVTWSVTPSSGIASLSCTNCTSPTLTKIGTGGVTLTATVVYCTIVQVLSLSIPVGIPDYTKLSIVSQGPNVCPNVPVMFGARYNGNCTNLNAAGITNINWNVSPTPTQIVYNAGTAGCGPGNNSGVTIKFPSQPTQYNVRISAQNACGTSDLSNAYVVQVMQSGCGGFLYTVSPNPATGQVTIQPVSSSISKTVSNTISVTGIKLFDQSGNLKKQWTFAAGSKQAQINVTGLTTGVYTIEIADGKNKERQKLVVNGQ